MLLVVALFSIWFAAVLAIPRAFALFLNRPFAELPLDAVVIGLAVYAPAWAPIGVIGYALGRRTVSVWMLLVAAAAEILALLATAGAAWYWSLL